MISRQWGLGDMLGLDEEKKDVEGLEGKGRGGGEGGRGGGGGRSGMYVSSEDEEVGREVTSGNRADGTVESKAWWNPRLTAIE